MRRRRRLRFPAGWQGRSHADRTVPRSGSSGRRRDKVLTRAACIRAAPSITWAPASTAGERCCESVCPPLPMGPPIEAAPAGRDRRHQAGCSTHARAHTNNRQPIWWRLTHTQIGSPAWRGKDGDASGGGVVFGETLGRGLRRLREGLKAGQDYTRALSVSSPGNET